MLRNVTTVSCAPRRASPSIGRVQPAANLQFGALPARAEDICLAADEYVIDRRFRGATVGPSLTVVNRSRRCETEAALVDGQRLAVRARRPRLPDRRYVVDLRFLDEVPHTRRSIAWNCWLGSLAAVTAAGLVAWLAANPLRASPEVPAAWALALGLFAIGLLVGAVAAYRTHERLVLHSVHGRIALVEFVGCLGCTRAAAAFTSAVAQAIDASRRQAPQSRQQYLRDELREHRRLFEDGVISSDVYEAGKRRILQSHD